ncbi:MAG: hypothetical protein AVDCRST_MAG32-2931, partial [uncultured Nocardioides sp.]
APTRTARPARRSRNPATRSRVAGSGVVLLFRWCGGAVDRGLV